MSSLNHEKILRLLHQNAMAIVESYDEPLAIMFAVVWQPSLGDDLPFGTAVFKHDEGQTDVKPEVMLSCLKQVSKLGLHLTGNTGSWLKSLQLSVSNTHKLQEEVNDLKKRLRQYEPAETTRPVDGGNIAGGPPRPGSKEL